MATYYVDNDVGPTGGSGTMQDPYGVETAIGVAGPGDVFYWRGGDEGDLDAGHTVSFDRGGNLAAPVRWIGTDGGWAPTLTGDPPHTGIDANEGQYAAMEVVAPYQVFESLRIGNTHQGAIGGHSGCCLLSSARSVVMLNCVSAHCGTGFASEGRAQIFMACRCVSTCFGFQLSDFAESSCVGCVVSGATGDGFRTLAGGAFIGCSVCGSGGSGILLRRYSGRREAPLTVDRFSAWGCVDAVTVHAQDGPDVYCFSVTNSILAACSGYALNIAAPAGQVGVALNNGTWSCAAGTVPGGCVGLAGSGWVELPENPFVAPANGDLSLIRSTPAIGAGLDGGDLGAFPRRRGRAIPAVVTVS